MAYQPNQRPVGAVELYSGERVIVSIGRTTVKVFDPSSGFLSRFFPRVIVKKNVSEWGAGIFAGSSALLDGVLIPIACCASTSELREKWPSFPNPMGVWGFLESQNFIIDQPKDQLKWILFKA